MVRDRERGYGNLRGEKEIPFSGKGSTKSGQQLGKQFMQISKSTPDQSVLHGQHWGAGFSGAMLLKLKNGCKDYVSRTYLPEFKNILGYRRKGQ